MSERKRKAVVYHGSVISQPRTSEIESSQSYEAYL